MDNLDLVHYIEQARKSGMGDEQIKQGLLQGGWQPAQIDEAFGHEFSISNSQFSNKSQILSFKSVIHNSLFVILVIVIAILGYFALAYYLPLYPFEQVAAPIPTFTPRPALQVDASTYHNDQFGFSIALPNSWKGYMVNQIKEDIYDVSGKTKTNNGVVEGLQLIELHHPSETPQNPREVMPIMIFTPAQWAHIQKEEWSVGAAPIPPTLLSQNSKYIMALPARYNYDYKTGWEEVDRLVHTLKAFEPRPSTGSGQSSVPSDWKTYRNEKNGFEISYPDGWFMRVDPNNEPWVFQSSDFSNNVHGIGLPPLGDMWVNIAHEPCQDYDTGFVNENTNLEIDISEKTVCQNNFQITLDLWNKDQNYNQHKQLLDQILSMLRFIEPADISTTLKTYINDKYGYSIKYPSNWNMDARNANDDLSRTRIADRIYKTGAKWILFPGDKPDDLDRIDFQIAKSDPAITLDQFIDSYISGSNLKKDQIMINGHTALRVETVDAIPDQYGHRIMFVLIPYEDKAYIFAAFNSGAESIINTFKFLK